MVYNTEQESFWAGKFGDIYCKRCKGEKHFASRIAMIAEILKRTNSVQSIIEYGPNIGLNLKALQFLAPHIELTAVEINKTAIRELKKIQHLNVINSSILEFAPGNQWDMVLISGVLIHINPNYLTQVYQLLYDSSSRFICLSEYYNPTPVTVQYRGHDDKLFKRDFAGELLDMFSDLKLVDYRFVYHRDPSFPADDVTWFLLEKTGKE